MRLTLAGGADQAWSGLALGDRSSDVKRTSSDFAVVGAGGSSYSDWVVIAPQKEQTHKSRRDASQSSVLRLTVRMELEQRRSELLWRPRGCDRTVRFHTEGQGREWSGPVNYDTSMRLSAVKPLRSYF